MRHWGRGIGSALLGCLLVRDAQALSASQVAGCYRFVYPNEGSGASRSRDDQYAPFGWQIDLTLQQVEGELGWYWVDSNPGPDSRKGSERPMWRVLGDRVEVSSHTALSGVILSLHSTDSGLAGVAKSSWDVAGARPEPVAISAHRIACAPAQSSHSESR